MDNSVCKDGKFTAGTAPPLHTPELLQHWYPQQGMASLSQLKYHFNAKENTKRFFNVYENVVMKTKTDEEKANSLVAYLYGEAFEYYIDNFTKDDAPNE